MKLGEAQGTIHIELRTEDPRPGTPTLGETFAERVARFYSDMRWAIGMAITEVSAAGASFAEIGEAMGRSIAEGFAAGLADQEYWRPRADAPRVRPVGRKSNSREWLAWDYTASAWRPVVRRKGGQWWWR